MWTERRVAVLDTARREEALGALDSRWQVFVREELGDIEPSLGALGGGGEG